MNGDEREDPQPVVPFAGCFATAGEAASERLVFAGLPDDSRSTFRRGAAAGPRRIRLAYDGRCFSATTESGVDLAGRVADLGDWRPADTWQETARTYHKRAAALYRTGHVPFFAGGDHAVTVPVVRALAELDERVHVVQIDAHPDLYPHYDGDPDSHACVAARLLEMDHVASITQLGIRTMNQPQEQVATRHRGRVQVLHARDLPGEFESPSHLQPGALVYLTVDLDGFDPAFAPGVAHPVPGGLTPRQVLNLIQRARWRWGGMDVVELLPERDEGDRTAILAARLLHEGMGRAASDQ